MRDNIKGKRFGRLIAVKPTEHRANHHIVWQCECDCGNTHFVNSSVLRAGLSNSCGCWRKERLTKHSGSGTRLYRIWKNIKKRCSNPNNPKWHRYGGRGIELCEEWNDYGVFLEWAMVNGYRDDLSIDRKNNDLGYSPENCQWITLSENSKKGHIDVPRTLLGRKRDSLGRVVPIGN